MSLPWFRLYAETVDDAKLRLLAFEDRWHYVALLCCKAQGLLDAARPELLERTLGVKLGLAARELEEVKRRLLEVGLIGANWQPTGWDRRQYASDTSAERTRRWRSRHSPPVPPSKNTDTDTDTEGDVTSDVTETSPKKRPSRRVPEGWEPRPEDTARLLLTCPHADPILELAKFRDHEFQRARSDWDATWRNWMREAESRAAAKRAPQLTKYERNMARLRAPAAMESLEGPGLLEGGIKL